jgi:glycerol-3-phosphate dehydrogenase
MNRDAMLRAVEGQRKVWDMVVIGGGATGVGIALDAITRGYSVCLFEAIDFGKGTSSRSTKLVHGGVRYLRSGQIALVKEALEERGILRRNAPEIVKDLAFIVPVYHAWEWPFYGSGLKMYDWLASRYGFGRTQLLSRAETVERLPGVRAAGLLGGILYHDGQFEDARLLIQIARTAADEGAVLVNHAPVTSVRNRVVTAVDKESGAELRAEGRVVISAAGPFTDQVRRLAGAGTELTLAASQGAHIVVHPSFLPGPNGLMVPRTSDGRVLFAIPWQGHTLIGTTDTPVRTVSAEPRPLDGEIQFILETARCCMKTPPRVSDVLSAFAGIRPLVLKGTGRNTAALSRDHTIRLEPNGMLTILGGKWTTYRNMAEDCVNRAAELAGIPPRACRTKMMPIRRLDVYPPGPRLHRALPYTEADIVHAARFEMARSVEDALARRTRSLFLNAEAALAAAPRAAELMGAELGWSDERTARSLADFRTVAEGYRVKGY